MSRKTKEFAQRLLEIQTASGDPAKFLQDIEDKLQAIKGEAGNDIINKGFYNREIPEFLRDAFPEIQDINGFLNLLEVFGLNRGYHNKDLFSGAYVFSDEKKSGFLMFQQPLVNPQDSIQRSHFCLLYQRDEKGNPILSLAGVNGKRILAASYEFSPDDKAYIQKSFDIGVDEEEIKGFNPVSLATILSLRHFEKEKESPLITKTMLRKALFHNWLLSPGKNLKILDRMPVLQQFAEIPQVISTKT